MIRMSNADGFWWTRDTETYHGGPCATREEAIRDAINDGDLDVGDVVTTEWCTIRHIALSQSFDADSFLEGAEDGAEDFSNEDGEPVFDVSGEQKADLQVMVRAAIDEWQKKHNLGFSSWYFHSCTQEEQHTITEEDLK
jgi:hypothetical protein